MPPLLGGGLSLIDGVSPVSGASRVARSRLAREGALIFYWDLGGYQRIYIYIYIMPHSGCWLVIVSPYEAGGGLRRARGRRGCAGECAINCCHHRQTWPKSGTSKSGQVCCAAEAKIMEAGIVFAMATSRASCAAGRQAIQDCSTSSESSQHGASGHRSRIQACAQQSCAKSGNVLCCAGEGLCHAGNLPSTRNRCLRRQAC